MCNVVCNVHVSLCKCCDSSEQRPASPHNRHEKPPGPKAVPPSARPSSASNAESTYGRWGLLSAQQPPEAAPHSPSLEVCSLGRKWGRPLSFSCSQAGGSRVRMHALPGFRAGALCRPRSRSVLWRLLPPSGGARPSSALPVVAPTLAPGQPGLVPPGLCGHPQKQAPQSRSSRHINTYVLGTL